jgi:FAD:protein FMN transferase
MVKKTKIQMGMPVAVEIVDSDDEKDLTFVFNYFQEIDTVFSTYKKDSEISKFNRGELAEKDLSKEVKEVLKLCEATKKETNGYFDAWRDGYLDPSGLVKGWAIYNASAILKEKGFKNFYIDGGGDIQIIGQKFPQGDYLPRRVAKIKNQKWTVGIRNPFNIKEIVKVLSFTDCGIATSGTYERGEHIYNPKTGKIQNEIVSFTVVGPNVYEADRFATACFAMGRKGMELIASKESLEGYMIDRDGIATFTPGFEKYVVGA